jgi:membrane-bound lytic murein transglycosylase B
MRYLSFLTFLLFFIILKPLAYATPHIQDTPHRGWTYVAKKLRVSGVSENEIRRIFESPAMPIRPFVPFGLKPQESHAIYKNFNTASKIATANEFLYAHNTAYNLAEQRFRVSRYIINAILLVETQFGKVVGRSRVVERLARGASVGEESNIIKNYRRLIKNGERTTVNEVRARAIKVEKIFFPQLRALFDIGRREKIDILDMRGSTAGAFGYPQFMPLAYLQFGIDGNKDGKVSLFNPGDAIFSVGRYLAHHGWRNDASHRDHLRVIWNYNKSIPYGETVLAIANRTVHK